MGRRKKTENPKGTKVTKPVMFDLTEAEFAKKGQEAAALSKEIQSLELDFEITKKDWQAKIKDREVKRNTILNLIHSKKEERIVETTMTKNFEAKLVEFWFEGQVVEHRAMTPDELQMELDFQAAQKAPKKSAAAETEPRKKRKYTRRQKTSAAPSQVSGSDVADVIREETGRRTKLSSVDGAVA